MTLPGACVGEREALASSCSRVVMLLRGRNAEFFFPSFFFISRVFAFRFCQPGMRTPSKDVKGNREDNDRITIRVCERRRRRPLRQWVPSRLRRVCRVPSLKLCSLPLLYFPRRFLSPFFLIPPLGIVDAGITWVTRVRCGRLARNHLWHRAVQEKLREPFLQQHSCIRARSGNF